MKRILLPVLVCFVLSCQYGWGYQQQPEGYSDGLVDIVSDIVMAPCQLLGICLGLGQTCPPPPAGRRLQCVPVKPPCKRPPTYPKKTKTPPGAKPPVARTPPPFQPSVTPGIRPPTARRTPPQAEIPRETPRTRTPAPAPAPVTPAPPVAVAPPAQAAPPAASCSPGAQTPPPQTLPPVQAAPARPAPRGLRRHHLRPYHLFRLLRRRRRHRNPRPRLNLQRPGKRRLKQRLSLRRLPWWRDRQFPSQANPRSPVRLDPKRRADRCTR